MQTVSSLYNMATWNTDSPGEKNPCLSYYSILLYILDGWEALYNYMPNFVCMYFSMKRVYNFIQTFKGIHDPQTTISGIRIKSQTEQNEILALLQIPPKVFKSLTPDFLIWNMDGLILGLWSID